MVRSTSLIVIAALSIGAAGPRVFTPGEKIAIAAVKAQLKDPDSAQFKGLHIKPDGSGCGWVNAKNGYGGYIGFGVFFVSSKGAVSVLPPAYSTDDLCK